MAPARLNFAANACGQQRRGQPQPYQRRGGITLAAARSGSRAPRRSEQLRRRWHDYCRQHPSDEPVPNPLTLTGFTCHRRGGAVSGRGSSSTPPPARRRPDASARASTSSAVDDATIPALGNNSLDFINTTAPRSSGFARRAGHGIRQRPSPQNYSDNTAETAWNAVISTALMGRITPSSGPDSESRWTRSGQPAHEPGLH